MWRSHLARFTASRYSKGARDPWKLDVEIREVIAWRIANVTNAAPRRVQLETKAPVLLYKDASGKGRVAAVLFTDGKRRAID